MKGWILLAVSVVLAGVPARNVAGQSLGELAQKEKEKRKAKPESAPTPTKVFTGEDLEGIAATREPEGKGAKSSDSSKAGSSRPPEPPLSPADPSADPPSIETLVPDESATRAAQETVWRGRRRAADAALKAADQEAESAQRARNALGPAPGPAYDPIAWASAVSAADARLAGAQAAQKLAKDAVPQLEEDARRAGIPPGWIR